MANNLPTTFIQKLQVGERGEFEDTFAFKVQGKTGAFGWPIFSTAERDALWLNSEFPNPAWKGATIYNSTMDRVQFNTGNDWFTFEAGGAPTSIAAFYQPYADDATYELNQGAAVNGSVYYNTTLLTVRVYSNGQWYNDLIPEPWTNSTKYNVGQIVWDANTNIYRCITPHTSSAFPATIEDDIANWINMGAHNIGELMDVDTTGVVDGDVLEWDTDKFIVSAKGTLDSALTLAELATDPTAPIAGFIKIYAKTDKRLYIQDSDSRVTLLEVPLDVLHYKIEDASNLDAGNWVELIAATSALVRRAQIFDLTGMNLEIGIGASSSEVTKFVTGQGTNESIDVEIPSGSRVVVRAADGADAYNGQLVFNFLG